MGEIKRNKPCPCGSGKKYKKCCIPQKTLLRPISLKDFDGMPEIKPCIEPSPEDIEKINKIYHENIRETPQWNEMVRKYGREKMEIFIKDYKLNFFYEDS